MINASANRCEDCDGAPAWTVLRRGDVAKTWACTQHLGKICESMQRDWEITQLVITPFVKTCEWAEINAALRDVVDSYVQQEP